MGAEFTYYLHRNNPTKEELYERFNDEQEQAGFECGRGGYSGTLYEKSGLTIFDKVYDTEDEAFEELEQNPKWGNAWAIPYKAQVTVPKSSKNAKIDALGKAKTQLANFKNDSLQAIKNAKSKTIGCKKCGSSVNRNYVNSFNCVVCGSRNSYMSNTVAKRLKAKEQKVKDCTIALQSVSNETKKTTGVNYLVGGFCSC